MRADANSRPGFPVLGLAATILLQSFSFLSLKFATQAVGLVTAALFVIALLIMFARAVLWQELLARGDISTLYPYTALVQVLLLVYAYVLFSEPVTGNNIIGAMLMIVGSCLMAGDSE